MKTVTIKTLCTLSLAINISLPAMGPSQAGRTLARLASRLPVSSSLLTQIGTTLRHKISPLAIARSAARTVSSSPGTVQTTLSRPTLLSRTVLEKPTFATPNTQFFQRNFSATAHTTPELRTSPNKEKEADLDWRVIVDLGVFFGGCIAIWKCFSAAKEYLEDKYFDFWFYGKNPRYTDRRIDMLRWTFDSASDLSQKADVITFAKHIITISPEIISTIIYERPDLVPLLLDTITHKNFALIDENILLMLLDGIGFVPRRIKEKERVDYIVENYEVGSADPKYYGYRPGHGEFELSPEMKEAIAYNQKIKQEVIKKLTQIATELFVKEQQSIPPKYKKLCERLMDKNPEAVESFAPLFAKQLCKDLTKADWKLVSDVLEKKPVLAHQFTQAVSAENFKYIDPFIIRTILEKDQHAAPSFAQYTLANFEELYGKEYWQMTFSILVEKCPQEFADTIATLVVQRLTTTKEYLIAEVLKKSSKSRALFTQYALQNFMQTDPAVIYYIMQCEPETAPQFAQLAVEHFTTLRHYLVGYICKFYPIALKKFTEMTITHCIEVHTETIEKIMYILDTDKKSIIMIKKAVNYALTQKLREENPDAFFDKYCWYTHYFEEKPSLELTPLTPEEQRLFKHYSSDHLWRIHDLSVPDLRPFAVQAMVKKDPKNPHKYLKQQAGS